MDKINLAEKLGAFDETWVPKIVAELNGQYVKVAKFEGEYVWHAHDHEDELFWVLAGELEMHLRDRVVRIGPGELFVVPRGVEHKPVAPGRVECVLFEPASTVNTGESGGEYTIQPGDLQRI